MVRLVPARRLRAVSLRTNPNCRMARSIRARVCGTTTPGWFRKFDTVEAETPATAATSLTPGRGTTEERVGGDIANPLTVGHGDCHDTTAGLVPRIRFGLIAALQLHIDSRRHQFYGEGTIRCNVAIDPSEWGASGVAHCS